jgi:hypothetical protein
MMPLHPTITARIFQAVCHDRAVWHCSRRAARVMMVEEVCSKADVIDVATLASQGVFIHQTPTTAS